VQILPALRLMLPASRVTFFTLSVEVEALALALGATAVVAKEEPALLLATLRRLAAEGGRPAPEVQVPRPPGPHPVR